MYSQKTQALVPSVGLRGEGIERSYSASFEGCIGNHMGKGVEKEDNRSPHKLLIIKYISEEKENKGELQREEEIMGEILIYKMSAIDYNFHDKGRKENYKPPLSYAGEDDNTP